MDEIKLEDGNWLRKESGYTDGFRVIGIYDKDHVIKTGIGIPEECYL
ncbi:MAG: hypothetical protein HZB65_02815 [Candidatus Aenigmarchaeota archaeon]|nr:hypothetical protein [Candidatus Aenigmarchaeota archaeon]